MKPTFLLLFFFSSIYSYSQNKTKYPMDSPSPATGLIINDDVTRILIHNSSGDRAHDYVQQISLWDRQEGTKDISTAMNWVREKAIEFGLSNVITEHYEEEGSYIWHANKGELWALNPYTFKITSYADLPMSLAQNSYSIQDTVQLIDIGTGDDSDYQDKELKGKIVLTSSPPGSVFQRAIYEEGAIGVISYYSVPYWDKPNRLEGDFPDQVGWAGVPKADTKEQESFAFMISERKAKELKELLAKGKKIELMVDISTELKSGGLSTLGGVIKGSKYPEEEIVVTAHIDHYKPGANDNASGSAAILEIIRTLNHLIDTKQLPQPLRTIRFLWVPEFSGTTAWISKHASDPEKRIVNLNFDMLGANLKNSNSNFSICYTPDWNASYINAFMESILDFMNKYNKSRYPVRKDFNIISVGGSRTPLNGSMERYTRGTDHQIFNDFRIPGIGFSTWPDNFYHSSEDTPDKVDPTQLHRVIFAGLASILMTAYSDDQHAFDIVELVRLYGAKRIADDVFKAQELIFQATNPSFSKQIYFANKAIEYAYKRERQALRSCSVLAGSKEAQELIESRISQYQRQQSVNVEQLELLARQSAKSRGISYKKYTPNADEIAASRLTPLRLKGKELFTYASAWYALQEDSRADFVKIRNSLAPVLDKLREREVSELRIYQFIDVIASYADGNRSILDIRDALFAEYYIELPIEVLNDIFRIFEKAEAMTIKQGK